MYSLGSVCSAYAETPSMEEMWELIKEQQREIKELQDKLEKATRIIEQTSEQVELTADVVEEVQAVGISNSSWLSKTSIGGYGEYHYNNLEDRLDTIGGDDSLNRSDFHRFVVFLGYQFSDSVRFFSEVELEHALAGDGAPGEIELEQAWLEFDLNDRHRIRTGLDILPIGILNPTHEPNTFYGVERNLVETEIIPTTWWEAGGGLSGELQPGWNYDLVLHTGLATSADSFRPRSGRLKVANADDQDIAVTGRLRYTGIAGLELGVSAQYQNDYTGGNAGDISATLLETHIDWKHSSGFGLRALYARWDIGSDGDIDPAVFNAEVLDGWYIEPAYRFPLFGNLLGEIGLFMRYAQWDARNQLDSLRYVTYNSLNVGFNWWPIDNIAFKLDYQNQDVDAPADRELDGINLGFGFQF